MDSFLETRIGLLANAFLLIFELQNQAFFKDSPEKHSLQCFPTRNVSIQTSIWTIASSSSFPVETRSFSLWKRRIIPSPERIG